MQHSSTKRHCRSGSMSFLVRTLLFASGAFVALFVARDAPNFSVLQTIAAAILCAVIVAAIAIWPTTHSDSSTRKDKDQ